MRFVRRALSVIVLSSFLFTLGCTGPGSQRVNARNSDTLDETQKFTLKDIKSEPVRLTELLKENKSVLVNFWATWCPPCREEIPDLIKLQEKFKGKPFVILGVDVGESQRKVSNFVQKAGINYPVVLDGDMKVSEAYSIYGIPTSILISSEGKVLGEYHGFSPELVADVEKTQR